MNVRVSASKPELVAPVEKLDMQEKINFLKEDLQHLFDDQGIDASQYDEVVDFLDPITKYSDIQGYMFNIKFLKLAFNPKFELHDIKQTDDTAVTTRWTMTMDFLPSRVIPPLAKVWSPSIIFTGTSTYVFNPKNGKICKHIDTWDSISNQKFFSLEGFIDFLKQLGTLSSTPNLETPQYTILRRARDYQVRTYPPYLVAEALMEAAASQPATQGVEVNPAGAGTRAFRSLAEYIFGGNDRGEKMAMTTPVFSDSRGNMQFVIGPSSHKSASSLPAPRTSSVSTRMNAGGLFAVRTFSGLAAAEESKKQQQELRASLLRDGLSVDESQPWVLARYNDPSAPPPVRRNEVLIPLKAFDLWKA